MGEEYGERTRSSSSPTTSTRRSPRRRAQGAARVQVLRGFGGRDARSAGRGDVPPLEARPQPRRRGDARLLAELLRLRRELPRETTVDVDGAHADDAPRRRRAPRRLRRAVPWSCADESGLARQPVPPRADLGRRRARTSRSSPSRRRRSSSASSTRTGARSASALTERTAFNWHCYLPGVGPGQRYGYRVARAVGAARGQALQPGEAPDRPVREGDRRPGRLRGRERPPLSASAATRTPTSSATRRTTRRRSRSRSSSTRPSTGRTTARPRRRGRRPSSTRCTSRATRSSHPAVREDLRGTYAGLASEEALAHLRSLGVTAVELLPIHHIADEPFLDERGLTNYWGYSSIGYLAPHALYAATARPRTRVQGHGQGAAPRRNRGHPRRRLQPHRGGQPPRPDALPQRASTTRPTTASSPTTRASTWTTPGRATASTRRTPRRCG